MYDCGAGSGDGGRLVSGHSRTWDVVDNSSTWCVQKTEALTVHDSTRMVQRAVAGATQAVSVTKVDRPGVVMDFGNPNCTRSIAEAIDVSRGVLNDSRAWLRDGGHAVSRRTWTNTGDRRAWLVGKRAGTVSRSRFNGGDRGARLVGDSVDVVGRSGPVCGNRGSRLVGHSSVSIGRSGPDRGDSLSWTVSHGPVAVSGSRVHRGHGLTWMVEK